MINSKNCIGCGACVAICPKNCISLIRDRKGFLIPTIDENLCVSCNKCDSVCPKKKCIKNNLPKECYAAYAKKDDVIITSSSGGVFSILASEFINNGGVVYGAAFDSELNLSHICVRDLKLLEKIQGSKYIQSDMQWVIGDIKDRLIKGQKVLFCGTPCQVAAINNLFFKYNNLYLIDILCHGTPSNRLFYDYIADIENREKKKVIDFSFRNKELLDTLYGFKYILEDNKKNVNNGAFTPFGKAFFDGLVLRDSCYNCSFSTKERVGDVTLGDYWGCNIEHPEFYNTKGVSCVLINSKKGNQLINESVFNLNICKTSISKISKYNHNLNSPTLKNDKTDMFWRDYDKYGYNYIRNKYLRNKKLDILKRYIKLLYEGRKK